MNNQFLIPNDFSTNDQEHLTILQNAMRAIGQTVPDFSNTPTYAQIKDAATAFQRDNGLAETGIISKEAIALINRQLEELYRIGGIVSNSYGLPIEGVTLKVFISNKTSAQQPPLPDFTATTLEDGSYRIYIQNDSISDMLTKKSVLKKDMRIKVELYQDGHEIMTKENLVISEKDSVFDFSSDDFVYKGQPVYEKLMDILSDFGYGEGEGESSLEDLTPMALKELSNDSGIDMETLMKLFYAENMIPVGNSPFKPEFNFALLYQNLPLNMPPILFEERFTELEYADWHDYKSGVSNRMRFGIICMKPEQLQTALTVACRQSIILPDDSDGSIASQNAWVENMVSEIVSRKKNAYLGYPILEGDTSIGAIFTIVNQNYPPNCRELTYNEMVEIATLFIDHISDFDSFICELEKLAGQPGYESAPIEVASMMFQVSRVTRNHELLIMAILSLYTSKISSQGVRYLATLSQSDWHSLIGASGIAKPADFSSKTEYGEFVYNNAQKLYPEVATIARLKEKEMSEFDQLDRILAIILAAANKERDILLSKFQDFTIPSSLGIPQADMEEVEKQFNAIQRILRIAPTSEAAVVLLENGITGSSEIYFMGKEQFEANFKGQMSAEDIDTAYNVAAGRISHAIRASSSMSDLFNHAGYYVNSSFNKPHLIDKLSNDLPGLADLFGNIDYLETNFDSTVYSPAAYLADLLAFLDKCKTRSGETVLEVLEKRRPDITNIILNEQNTVTVLPYIDLVCEILEEEVLKIEFGACEHDDCEGADMCNEVSSGYRRAERTCQSTLTSEELCAAPEHIQRYNGRTAYDVIKNSVYPIGSPLNLNQMESRAFLKKMGIEWHELMEVFNDGSVSAEIAAEYFGLTPMELDVVIKRTGLSDRNKAWDLKVATGGTVKSMTLEDFMRQSGLAFTEALDLLGAEWTGLTLIEHDSSPRFGKAVQGTLEQYDRAHRFIRLWRKSGWKIWELDLLLNSVNTLTGATTTGTDILNENTLCNLYRFSKQQKKFNLSCESLLALYGNINIKAVYEDGKGRESLYKKLFLNTAISNPVSNTLRQIGNGSGTINAYGEDDALIVAALSMSPSDYAFLKESYGSGKSHNLAYLSFLYRYAVLAQKLRITIAELVSVLKMTGLFNKDTTRRYAPEDVEKLLVTMKSIQASNITVSEYEYLLNYGYNFNGNNPDGTGTAMSLEQLDSYRETLLKEFDNFSFIDAPKSSDFEVVTSGQGSSYATAKSSFREKFFGYLSQMHCFKDDKTKEELIFAIEGRPGKTAEEVVSWISQNLPFADLEVLCGDITTNILVLTNRYRHAIDCLVSRSDQATAIINHLAVFFDIPSSVVDTYLSLADIDPDLQTFAFTCLYAKTHEDRISNVNRGLVSIHKMALIVRKTGISSSDLKPALGIPLISKILYILKTVSNEGNGSLERLLNWMELYRLHKKYGVVDGKSLFGIFSHEATLSEIDEEDLLAEQDLYLPGDTLCKTTGWDVVQYNDLIQASGEPDFSDISSFAHIEECMSMQQKANVPIPTLFNWSVRPNTDTAEATQAQSIKSAAKALYDTETWLKELPALQKPIREAKADALAAYIIEYNMRHSSNPVENKAGLYNHFLLDTEMTADMKTSRIVLATSSVQLLLQRCFLNLEDEMSIDENLLKEWDWKRRYRLWEANRKVFLYPENWIEPELRDDKTPFFKELEDELNQAEVTNEHVETVFENYLQKLDEVSNLFICGINREVVNGDDGYIGDDGNMKNVTKVDRIHVVARTRSTPYQYYYRYYDMLLSKWSHWEKIELDIKGDTIVPVIYNRRLHLFWLSTIEKAQNKSTKDEARDPRKYMEVQLGWSVLKNKKWSPVSYSAKKHIQSKPCPITDFSLITYHDTKKNELIFDFRYPQEDAGGYWYTKLSGRFYFNGEVYKTETNSKDLGELTLSTLTKDMEPDSKPISIAMSSDGAYSEAYMRASRIYSEKKHTAGTKQIYLRKLDSGSTGDKFITTTNQDPNTVQMIHNRLGCHLDDTVLAHLFHPFFYQDSERSFFVVPFDQEIGKANYRFCPFYHPFANIFIKELNRYGIKGILNRDIQQTPYKYFPNKQSNTLDFVAEYTPENNVFLADAYQGGEEVIDFHPAGAYSVYNWELFFHAPLYIACKLTQNQKFEEAMQWFHYIFNPTDRSEESAPAKFWIYKPFASLSDEYTQEQQIEAMLNNVTSEVSVVTEWLNNPFNPHLIARHRMEAYQKAVVMKYLDNLIAWADQLFRQDTMESTNEATLLYILAYQILGERPVIIPKETIRNLIAKKYRAIKEERSMDHFLEMYEDAMKFEYEAKSDIVSIANPQVWAPGYSQQESNYQTSSAGGGIVMAAAGNNGAQSHSSGTSTGSADLHSSTVQGHTVSTPIAASSEVRPLDYFDVTSFGIPYNDQMLGYWDTVEDRLFKLRHCMNIEGKVRELPLFAPPIDPAMLVKAAAAGLSIADALNDISARQPYYRFRTILQKAIEFTGEVKQLGDKLLSALEKKDAEVLSALRSAQEVTMQEAMVQVRNLQIEEAKQSIQTLTDSIRSAEERKGYYEGREFMNDKERKSQDLVTAANTLDNVVSGGHLAIAISAMIPDFGLGGAGAMGSPFVNATIGGKNISTAMHATMAAMSQMSQILNRKASTLLTKAGYERRKEDWDFQAELAKLEIEQINQQITGAEIRLMMAEKELQNLEMQIEQSKSVKEYYKDKYTNEKLYNWMITQISNIYFQAYQLAYDMAKKAEKCYRHELGMYDNSEPSYINFGYWDSLNKGLLSGEKLMHDLHRLDAAYIDKNARTLELTKHISLAQMFPANLLELISSETKRTTLDFTEELFDMDYPGHYKRRIKSVSITIPNVSGPYTTVSCMLSLNSAKVRVKNTLLNNVYTETPGGNDPRFVYQTGGDAICTSSAQNDSGMFELNFNDERYLPFENAGAISKWTLSLPAGCDQIDLSTISDVILHINYTALDDGNLAVKAKEALAEKLPEAGSMLMSLKQAYPDSWAQMTDGNPAMDFDICREHLPYFLRGKANELEVQHVAVVVVSSKDNLGTGLTLTKGLSVNALSLGIPQQCGDKYLYQGEATPAVSPNATGTWRLVLQALPNGTTIDDIEDVIIGVNLK